MRCLFAVSCIVSTLGAQTPGQHGSALRARVVLGLEGVANNSTGDLSTQDDAIVFARPAGTAVRTQLSAIQGAYLSQEDKQVGGVPMALGRAAVPFGGGRVVGLFSHKKYDFLTVEFLDAAGGLHGTIYQLNRGQGEALATELAGKGVQVRGLPIEALKPGAEAKNVK